MAEISLTRLTGGNTPADGSDPRTFPAIWNASATAIEDAIAEGGGGSITVSETAPTDPAPGQGDLWWDSVNGKLFVYYVDGDSSQWVDAAGPSVAVQSSAPTGYEGQLWLDDTDGSMYVYYTDPGGGSSSWIGAVSRSGGILQVVSTAKTNTFTSGSADTWVNVTGLSASITPRSTSNKILILVDVKVSSPDAGGRGAFVRLTGGNSATYVGDASNSRTRAIGGVTAVASDETGRDQATQAGGNYLDAPATTSTITYQVQLFSANGTGASVNRANGESDDDYYGRHASSITLIEVAG